MLSGLEVTNDHFMKALEVCDCSLFIFICYAHFWRRGERGERWCLDAALLRSFEGVSLCVVVEW